MLQIVKQNVKLLSMIGIALAISVGLAGGIGGDRGRPGDLPPLRTQGPVATVAPTSRLVKPAADIGAAFTEVASKVTPGVVRIESEFVLEPPRRGPFGRRWRELGDSVAPLEFGSGTGFIVSKDGYIVTNNHVVEGADVIRVTLYDKRSTSAMLVGRDPTTDVALLKINGTDLPALSFGNSDDAAVGEWVLAIGNPGFQGGFGSANTLDFTVTSGIVSAKGRPLRVLNGDDEAGSLAIEDFLQTDAVINPGNSGGPLVNLRGEVIGMNTAIATTNGVNQGYAFAVPANLVQRVIHDLAQHGHVRRPLLGVTIDDVSQEDAEVFGLPDISGVRVDDFGEESPARQAGLQRGDVIVTINGQRVERVGQLQRVVAQNAPGDFVDVGIVRYGTRHNIRVKLMEAALETRPAPARPRPAMGAGRLGIEVVDLTRTEAERYGFDEAGGAMIRQVEPFSAAARKIEHGTEPYRILEINRTKVESLRDAQKLLRAMKSGDIVSLVLQRPSGEIRMFNVRVP